MKGLDFNSLDYKVQIIKLFMIFTLKSIQLPLELNPLRSLKQAQNTNLFEDLNRLFDEESVYEGNQNI